MSRLEGLPPLLVALGFRVRTGRATAVAVAGPVESPRVLDRRDLVIHDARVPESFQPYHAVLDLEGGEAERILRRATAAAREAALRAIGAWAAELRASGARPGAAAVVVGSGVDPGTISNPHMRAHASEGKLFGDLVREGLAASRIGCTVVLEAEVEASAVRRIGRSGASLREVLAAMGKSVGPPWRAAEKAAALAAWASLTSPDRRP